MQTRLERSSFSSGKRFLAAKPEGSSRETAPLSAKSSLLDIADTHREAAHAPPCPAPLPVLLEYRDILRDSPERERRCNAPTLSISATRTLDVPGGAQIPTSSLSPRPAPSCPQARLGPTHPHTHTRARLQRSRSKTLRVSPTESELLFPPKEVI